MAEEAVVVGGGPGALRTAVALAQAGSSVTLLQEGPWAGGVAHPDIPVGRGVVTRAPAALERLYGPFRPVDGYDRGVLVDGHAHRLPLSRAELARLVPATSLPGAALAWGRTRGAGELRKLIGGGKEQRTYRDWVEQRFGEPVYRRFHAPYCEARFGPPEEVSCNVARFAHANPEDGPWYAAAGGPTLATTGVDVRTDVVVKSVTGGQVDTEDGIFTGQVFVDITPHRLVGWLGAAAGTDLRNDAGLLLTRHAVQVLVRAPEDLPADTHVLGGAPFHRITRPGLIPGCGALDGHLLVHYAVEDGDPMMRQDDHDVVAATVDGLRQAGVEGASESGGRVQRIRDHHAVWMNNNFVRMRRFLLALEDLEITVVGRAGLHALFEADAEAEYLEAAIAAERPTLRALHRTYVEPPPLDGDARVHLTRLVER